MRRRENWQQLKHHHFYEGAMATGKIIVQGSERHKTAITKMYNEKVDQ